MQRSLRFLLPLLILSACQAPAGRQPVVNLQRAAAIDVLHGVDGEGDMLRHGPQQMTLLPSEGLQKTAAGVQLQAGKQSGRYLSPALKAPYTFNALMPAWQSSGNTRVEVRLSPDGKAWGSWMPLLPERSMLLPQSANFVQYQVTMHAGGPAPQFEGISFMFGKAPALNPKAQPGKAHHIPKPPIVSRAAWKAAPPKGDYTPHTPAAIVVHHTWVPRAAQYQKDVSIRGIQRYHMVDNKWMDIGYHFIIGPEGVIYQGRPENVVGAHSTPNTNYVGICVFGDFDPGQDVFTPESRAALLDLMTWLTAEYGINTNEFYGHRNFSTKSCPGDGIYNQLQEFKDEVTRRLRDAGVLPPATP